MYVLDSVFEMQMRFLKEHFHVLSFTDLLDLWKEGGWNKTRRYCVITFGDGWRDNYVNAYPILKTLNLPATIFLTTSLIGTNHWFWPERIGYILKHLCLGSSLQKVQKILQRYTSISCNDIEDIDSIITKCKGLGEEEIERLIDELKRVSGLEIPATRQLLNWDEIREMSSDNISFGSHTCTHKILTNCPVDVVSREVSESLQMIRDAGINSVPIFCYPNGSYSRETGELVKKAGYMAAVTTPPGVAGDRPDDLFCLNRVGVHNDIASTNHLFSFYLARPVH